MSENSNSRGGKGKMRWFSVLSLMLFFLAASVFQSSAGEPTNQLKLTVDSVIDMLKNKDMKSPKKADQRRAALRKTVGERFNYEEMAKRSLALHWRNRTTQEKKEFVSLYSELLEQSYVNKIESYTDEKIVYADEIIDGDYASVKTKIITKRNVEVPIEYRLLKAGTQWKVYDVVIEGVSLVNNYRNQFNRVIRTASYEELVKRLKNKQEEARFEDKAEEKGK
jgi:phospholipid transport system substrate-binding protein